MYHRRNERRAFVADRIEKFHSAVPTTLLSFMREVMKERSHSEVKRLLVHQHVQVNGVTTTQYDMPLTADDEVAINFARPFFSLSHRMVKLLYEDEALVVVEKQSGLLTVPAGNRSQSTAQDIVDEYVHARDGRSHAFIVHRLDQFTSGILIFAKTSEVQHMLRDAWTTYVVERRYMAVVEGTPEPPSGEIRTYLAENSAMRVYSTQNPEEGKLAVTRYETLQSNGSYSQVDVQILTGRKNQIRVHLSEMGCPVAGDRKYGAQSNPWGRLMLHNYVLQFIHPLTREQMRFELHRIFAK